MDIVIEFNDTAFEHNYTEEDIRMAFDTAVYDGWFNEGKPPHNDKYLLIGFAVNGTPLEILYNVIDDETVNVFHCMKCRSIYFHLIKRG